MLYFLLVGEKKVLNLIGLLKIVGGVSWGEQGYFRILRGKGTCGINTQVTTAILG
jgi:hypothetical protein